MLNNESNGQSPPRSYARNLRKLYDPNYAQSDVAAQKQSEYKQALLKQMEDDRRRKEEQKDLIRREEEKLMREIAAMNEQAQSIQPINRSRVAEKQNFLIPRSAHKQRRGDHSVSPESRPPEPSHNISLPTRARLASEAPRRENATTPYEQGQSLRTRPSEESRRLLDRLDSV